MYTFKIIAGILLFIAAYAQINAQETSDWNKDKERKHLINRQDSTTWNREMFYQDLDYRKKNENRLPINFGVWPVPQYALLGEDTFKGVGNGGNFTGVKLKDKNLVYAYFLVNRNRFTEQFINDKPNEVFFSIVVLTDFIDVTNYSHAGVSISSRNNPDYMGEGFFKTKENKIDYLAFLTANRDEYAVVNMRLFNLKHGRTILIAPQKDGSLRSMQIDGSIVSDQEIQDAIDNILLRDDVIEFFQKPGNI